MVFEKLRTTAKSKAIGEDIDPDNPTTRRGSDFTATSRTKFGAARSSSQPASHWSSSSSSELSPWSTECVK